MLRSGSGEPLPLLVAPTVANVIVRSMRRFFTTIGALDGCETESGWILMSIRRYLLTHPRAALLVESGEGVLGIRNAPAMVKAAVGAAIEERWQRVLLATECDLTDFRAAFCGLGGRLDVLTLPLTLGNAIGTRRDVEALRTAGQDGQQAPWWPSLSQGSFGQSDASSLAAPGAGKLRLSWPPSERRFVVAGPPAGITDLGQQASDLGWQLGLDLWELACSRRTRDWISDACSFASAIQEPLGAVDVAPGSCPPLILRSEPFCGTQLSEVAIRQLWPGPVLVLEAQRIGPMDAGQKIRLSAFLEMCSALGKPKRRQPMVSVRRPSHSEVSCPAHCVAASGTPLVDLHEPAGPTASDLEDRRVGIFSTMPQEVLWAAGLIPVDVNNLFIGSQDPAALIRLADHSGLPRTVCAWTRGLWGAVLASGLKRVVTVAQGDCSNNAGLSHALRLQGIRVIPFRYPLAQEDPQRALGMELQRLAVAVGTEMSSAVRIFSQFAGIRSALAALETAGVRGQLPGSLVRRLLLTSTDMASDPHRFASSLDDALRLRGRPSSARRVRLAVFGVPTSLRNLPEVLDEVGRCVLWETESDFAMIPPVRSLEAQYLRYAYPYGIARRLPRFVQAATGRRVDAVVRYQQAFCHHNLESPAVESILSRWPCFVLEGDTPGEVGARDRLRLEAFFGQLTAARWGGAASPSSATGRVNMSQRVHTTLVALDVGSRFAKVLVEQRGRRLSHMEATVPFLKRYSQVEQGRGHLALAELLRFLDLDPEPDPKVVATGYGRNRVTFGNALVVPEIQAHAAGALAECDDPEFLLVDVGGQDTKVLWLDNRSLKSFVMNDRCAAGSGRYAENMAALLGVPLQQLLEQWENPVELSSTCATFGESEVVGLIAEGVAYPRILAGVLASVASRTIQLVARIGAPETLPLVLAGGMASSTGLVSLLQQRWQGPIRVLQNPSWNGARGCLELGTSPVA